MRQSRVRAARPFRHSEPRACVARASGLSTWHLSTTGTTTLCERAVAAMLTHGVSGDSHDGYCLDCISRMPVT